MQPCPLGFVLNSNTGSCECSPILNNAAPFTRCNIANQMIDRPRSGTNSWAGLVSIDENTTTLGIAFQCPQGYCNNQNLPFCSNGNYINLSTTSDFTSTTSCIENATPLCLHNRNGTMCGQCLHGLSVVFGSYECKQCSNWWLLTLLVYAAAGPLVIFLLYTLKLTLTAGTINGIIFYAQVAHCGILDLLATAKVDNSVLKFLSRIAVFFISGISLDFGISLCFFNGMNELWKVGLCLLFPLYLLAIVAILIVLSRYSLRLSNRIADSSVQVLVTVVHLSFSKLLLTIINVFTPAEVYVNNFTYRVWFFDGSVEYASTSHLILMILTLTVVSSLLLPYMLLLLFAKPLRRTKINKYVQPLLEAIHAPYKEDKQYWFVGQLILTIVLFVVYAVFRSNNTYNLYIIITQFVLLDLVLHAYCKPFKSKAINVLHCWMIFNLVFVGTTTWYFFKDFDWFALNILVTSTVLLAFVTFLLIVTYHILLATGNLSCFMRWVRLLLGRCQQNEQCSIRDPSFYGSNNYREPLLASVSHIE